MSVFSSVGDLDTIVEVDQNGQPIADHDTAWIDVAFSVTGPAIRLSIEGSDDCTVILSLGTARKLADALGYAIAEVTRRPS